MLIEKIKQQQQQQTNQNTVRAFTHQVFDKLCKSPRVAVKSPFPNLRASFLQKLSIKAKSEYF